MSELRSSYRDVVLTLRPPRVAITFDGGPGWETRAAVALARCARIWGGSGFILVPHVGGVVHPAMLRLLRVYDPDHVAAFAYRPGELGVPIDDYRAAHPACCVTYAGEVYEPRPTSTALATTVFRSSVGDDPSVIHPMLLTTDRLYGLVDINDMRGIATQPVVLGVPENCRGYVGLAIAMRCGLSGQPEMPFTGSGVRETDVDTLRFGAVGYRNVGPTSEMIRSDPGFAGSGNNPESVPTAWSRSEVDLLHVFEDASVLRHPLILVGETAADYCFAFAYDRMVGAVTWIAPTWLDDHEQASQIDSLTALTVLTDANDYHVPVITSLSFGADELKTLVEEKLPQLEHAMTPDQSRYAEPILFVSPDQIVVGAPSSLACGPESYAVEHSLPTVEDDVDGIALGSPIPIERPGCEDKAPRGVPFWNVDVHIAGATTPAGRATRHILKVDGVRRADITVARSSRAGITFQACTHGLILAGQATRQSIARPLLRAPGLLEWLRSRCRDDGPFDTVLPSHPGRQATTAAQLFGGRLALADALVHQRPVFDEFVREKNAGPGEVSDGTMPVDGFGRMLTFDAILRQRMHNEISSRFDPRIEERIRDEVDSYVGQNVLRRGMILKCPECRYLMFVTVDDLRQMNVCRRCGVINMLDRRLWRKPAGEPDWYYDLHASIRHILKQNGDVPILASRHIASKSRIFADVVELDFWKVRARFEIDIVAYADGQVIVGEAKQTEMYGSGARRSEEIGKMAVKLVGLAAEIHADQVALFSASPNPWQADIKHALTSEIEGSTWTNGRKPTIRYVTGLRTSEPKDVDANGRLWVNRS